MTKTHLGSIADIITGPFGSALHQYEYVDEGVPVIMPQDIENRNVSYEKIAHITLQKAEELSRYAVIKNDIVYARRGDIEKHAFITSSTNGAICGTGCLRVRVKDTSVNPLFLSYYLDRSETRKWIVSHAVGSNMPNLNIDILSNIPVELPSKEEQDSIVSVLECIEKQIDNNTTICFDLETMAKLLYDYWFVQFDFPGVDGKPYKSSGGKMVWNEYIKRRIPEDWTVERLGNYCNFENGDRSNNYPSGDDFIPIGIPFIAGGAIKDNGIDYTELRYISEEKFCSLRAGKANYGDILMTLRGSLAKYVLSPFEKLAIASALVIVRPKGIVTNEYLYSVLTSDYYNRLMSNYNNGSVQANLSVDVVRTFPIIIPDKAIMDRFSKVQCELIKMKMLLDSENRQLTTIRDFLLPMLLNGQVKVKETENTLSEM